MITKQTDLRDVAGTLAAEVASIDHLHEPLPMESGYFFRRKLAEMKSLTAVAVVGMLMTTCGAMAGQATYESDCQSTRAGTQSTTVCTSEYTYSAHPRGRTRESIGYSISDEDRKAAARKASGYRDPPGTRELK